MEIFFSKINAVATHLQMNVHLLLVALINGALLRNVLNL